MSYIRCLSNPEGLYVYASDNGVNIHHCLRPPFSSKDTKGKLERTIVVPEKLFFDACHRWDHGPTQWTGPVSLKDLIIKEEHVFEDDGTVVPSEWNPFSKSQKHRKTCYRIIFKYKSQYIMLWRVTWDYVVKNAVDPEMEGYRCRWCVGKRKR